MIEIGDWVVVFLQSGEPVGTGYVQDMDEQLCHVLITLPNDREREIIGLPLGSLESVGPGRWRTEIPDEWWQVLLLDAGSGG